MSLDLNDVTLAEQLRAVDQIIHEASTALRLLPEHVRNGNIEAALAIYRRELRALLAVRSTLVAFAHLAEVAETPIEILHSAEAALPTPSAAVGARGEGR